MDPVNAVFDHTLGFAQECLGIAEDAMTKLAAVETKLRTAELTKEATTLPTGRCVEVVDILIKKGFSKRTDRAKLIAGMQDAGVHGLLDILEKTASVAVCPTFAFVREDGEPVEKAAGNTTDPESKSDQVWRKSLDEAAAEVGA